MVIDVLSGGGDNGKFYGFIEQGVSSAQNTQEIMQTALPLPEELIDDIENLLEDGDKVTVDIFQKWVIEFKLHGAQIDELIVLLGEKGVYDSDSSKITDEDGSIFLKDVHMTLYDGQLERQVNDEGTTTLINEIRNNIWTNNFLAFFRDVKFDEQGDGLGLENSVSSAFDDFFRQQNISRVHPDESYFHIYISFISTVLTLGKYIFDLNDEKINKLLLLLRAMIAEGREQRKIQSGSEFWGSFLDRYNNRLKNLVGKKE